MKLRNQYYFRKKVDQLGTKSFTLLTNLKNSKIQQAVARMKENKTHLPLMNL
jgi:hypothetical protein